MYVEPASIYSFVVASIASLVITHLMLHFHRSVNEKELNFDETKTKLSGKTTRMTHLVNIIILTAGILLISGSLFYSFNIEFKGAAGWVLPEDKKKSSYSLVTLGIIILNNLKV